MLKPGIDEEVGIIAATAVDEEVMERRVNQADGASSCVGDNCD